MLPFFPNMRPPMANGLWFDADDSCDDDAEVTALETEHQQFLNQISQIAADIQPIGRISIDPLDETDDEDAEHDANDESDDSNDSHDDEEDDDMEGNIDRTRNIIERIDYTYDPPDDTNNDIIQEVSPMA